MNISNAEGDQGPFKAAKMPGSDQRRDKGADAPDQRRWATQDHLWASAGPSFEVPIEIPVQLLREGTRRSEANLETMNQHTTHDTLPVCRALACPPVRTNRLARFLLSTRH